MNISKQQHEITLESKTMVNELVDRFGEMQEELKKSMENVEKLNSDEVQTGFWRGIRGKTDSEIAEHVKTLGMNLHTTQKVVMFLVDLSHAKNEVLRGFYDTLATKLIELDKEQENIVGDLSVSQQNERKIVYQIKEQIENRLAIEDSIEENRQKIDSNRNTLLEFSEDLQEKSELDNEQSDILKKHQEEIDILTRKVSTLQDAINNNGYPSSSLIHAYGGISFAALLLGIFSVIN